MQISTFNEYYHKLTTVEKKNSPKELFYKGDFSLWENGRRVAVVGFRKVSELVVRRVRKIVQNDINVVSNLVEGVDSIAHKTAIEFEGHTIGAIGTPLNKYVSAENKHLHDFIVENHLLISVTILIMGSETILQCRKRSNFWLVIKEQYLVP